MSACSSDQAPTAEEDRRKDGSLKRIWNKAAVFPRVQMSRNCLVVYLVAETL